LKIFGFAGWSGSGKTTLIERLIPLFVARELKARYRGLRVSFGYPACPELADQATLWRLLRPEEIGIALTEGFMMDPEASVSALVFHHPAAKYFKATAD